jgi:DNA-binding NarL/FixJ family response regulator
MHDNPALMRKMTKAGASAYLFKAGSLKEIVQSVLRVLD